MSLMNRSTLKNFFKRGSFPTEVNFSDLIDSMVNKVDDGFAKSLDNGMLLSPQGSSKRLLSFYENIRDKNPAWSFEVNPDNRTKGLSISEEGSKSRLFLKKGGNIGIGTTDPMYELDVNGRVAMKIRIGTYAEGQVPGDGQWHSILKGLDGNQAFEVIAQVAGKKGYGKYAMLHAIAMSCYGSKSYGSIRSTKTSWGFFWNRLQIRWTGTTHDFSLQIRTQVNYGLGDDKLPRMINYRITKLWSENDEQNAKKLRKLEEER